MAAQLGGWQPGKQNAASKLAAWIDGNAADKAIDLLVLSELALTPYFPTSSDRSWLRSGLRPNTPDFDDLVAVTTKHAIHLVVPFAELDDEGRLYNSAMMLGPDGELIPSVRVSGPNVGQERPTYRKAHLSENRNAEPGVHEKYFFNPGDGLALWETSIGIIAPLICYDRSFPEAWRVVADAGASVVVVPMATSRPERVKMFERELSVGANHNGVFAVAACKAGVETIDGNSVTYSGGSMVADPFGEIVGRAPPGEGDVTLSVDLDVDRLEEWHMSFHYRRDRRRDLYQIPNPRNAEEDGEEE